MTEKETADVLKIRYPYGEKIKEDQMSRACSNYGLDEKFIQDFDGETSRKEPTQKAQAQMGRIILKNFKEIGCKNLEWIQLAQN